MKPQTTIEVTNNAATADADEPSGVIRTATSASVPLEKAIVRGEQKIDRVTLRKPQSGELRGLQLATLMAMDVLALQTLLPRITSPALTAHDVASLDPADLLNIGLEITGFFMTRAEKASLPA